MNDNTRRALGGFILILPACTLVISGLLGRDPPATFIHPLLVIGGLAAALTINSTAVLSAKGQRGNGYVLGGVAVQFAGRWMNLAIIFVSLLLSGAIVLYLFVENFAPR